MTLNDRQQNVAKTRTSGARCETKKETLSSNEMEKKNQQYRTVSCIYHSRRGPVSSNQTINFPWHGGDFCFHFTTNVSVSRICGCVLQFYDTNKILNSFWFRLIFHNPELCTKLTMTVCGWVWETNTKQHKRKSDWMRGANRKKKIQIRKIRCGDYYCVLTFIILFSVSRFENARILGRLGVARIIHGVCCGGEKNRINQTMNELLWIHNINIVVCLMFHQLFYHLSLYHGRTNIIIPQTISCLMKWNSNQLSHADPYKCMTIWKPYRSACLSQYGKHPTTSRWANNQFSTVL